jgi:hypothetical protein
MMAFIDGVCIGLAVFTIIPDASLLRRLISALLLMVSIIITIEVFK